MPLRTVFVSRTDPALEPVTLAQTKAHLRVDGTSDDDLISALIASARAMAEKHLGRTLIEATWQAVADCFPLAPPTSTSMPPPAWYWLQPPGGAEAIELRNPPIRAVTSVQYLDPNGVLQTLDPSIYDVDSVGAPGRLLLKNGQSWPLTYPGPNAVRVTFTAGYGTTAADVPPPIKTWMLLHIGQFYRNRELGFAANGIRLMEVLPYADDLIDLFRIQAI